MRFCAPKVALLALALSPGLSLALGLGDIHLKSALNAPLSAEIDLIGATPEELAQLRVQMATRDQFARYGLEYPSFLPAIQVRVGRSTDGRDVILLTSTAPMTEPFATLLIEANLARERSLREYTVLFDPPVFAPGAQQATAPVAAPVVGAGERSGSIQREPAPAPAAQAQAQAPVPTPAISSAGESYTVRPGDTLSGIVRRVAPGEQDRAMIAIFRANPEAFDGNINVLKSGAVLHLPDSSSVSAIDPGEAAREVRRQSAAWSSAAPAAGAASSDPRLRLVVPGGPAGQGGNADAAEANALRDRVGKLENELSETRRLLELRNAELARLQSASPAAPVTPPPATAPAPAPVAEATPPPAPAETPAEAPAPEAAPPPAPKPETRPVATEPPAPGLIDKLKSYGLYILVGLLVLAAALLGLRAVRRRKTSSFDSPLGFGTETYAGRDSSSNTFPLRKPQELKEQTFLVEESTGTQERPNFTAQAPRKVDVDEAASTASMPALDATQALEQGDPLAEADFHMAYGLYDQAADLVRLAIEREPSRRDLKLKLLEVFFVWGNKDQFLQTARVLAESRAQAEPGEWEKIVIMGKQLAPEDPLFSGSTGGSVGVVDLNLEGGQNRVDFDLHGEPTMIAPVDAAVDLDLGSALGDRDPTGNSALDFTIDDPARGADPAHTATTRQMVQPDMGVEGGTLRFEGSEGPTVEQPQLEPGQTMRQKLDAQMLYGATDQTAELALDDLGLDLGKLESTGSNLLDDSRMTSVIEGQDAPTLVAGLGDTSRQLLSPDFPGALPTEVLPLQSDGSPTSRLRAIDFELADASATATTGTHLSPAGTVDLDVGTPETSSTGTFISTQRLAPGEGPMDSPPLESTARDLEPITMSEVGTKLDLARAYMDMGDPDGARNILNEVLQEGSPTQKQEAQRLLESIPG